jgi:arginine/lysine/ornithine decarboxylase
MMMIKNRQLRAPLFEALTKYAEKKIIHFDVPGHKKRPKVGLAEYFGDRIVMLDANSTRDLDMLSHPEGVIMEAEELMAEAYDSDSAFFLVNGSTFGVQAMILSACGPKDKILMPRNVHKSAINAIILSGAVPVFIEPDIDYEWGIANGITYDQVRQAIKANPDAKALFVINPTYFGVASDLGAIIKLCHRHHILVLVDEAHGAHFPFHPMFPDHAATIGADMTTFSMHKTGGSLTQSSVLLLNEKYIPYSKVRSIINLMQTTSASYLLMASLDLARRNLVMNGVAIYKEIYAAVEAAKKEIAAMPGLSVLTCDYADGQGVYDYDETKIVIRVNDLGMSGFEVFDWIRTNHNIQMELAESYVVLAVVGIGDDATSLAFLVEAFRDLSKTFYGKKPMFTISQTGFFDKPMTVVSPREAYYSQKRLVPMDEAVGEICGESIMIYPPGIPLAIPGEKLTEAVIEHYRFYRQQECVIMTDASDPNMIAVLGTENK